FLSIERMYFVIVVYMLAIGDILYNSDDLGAVPRDTLMLLAVKKLNCIITVARTVMEIGVAVAGYILGGPICVGTVIMAFALGPVIQVSLKYSQKALEKLLIHE